MICPKCGEDNSGGFRFCGMCGTLLEAGRPAGAPVPGLPPVLPKIANGPEPLRSPVMDNAARPANQKAPPIGGPSVQGANQPGVKQPSPDQASLDSLREKAFSGLDSFFEPEQPEQPKTGGRRILLLVALLAALGGAAWWTYTNYLGAAEGRKPEAATSSAGASAAKPTTQPQPATQDAAPTLDAGSSQPAAAPAGVAESNAENASAGAGPARSTRKTAEAEAKPAATAKAAIPRIALGDRSAEKREPRMTSVKPSQLPAPTAGDAGNAAFRRGEAYLYGRGVRQNCDEAVKYLKAASAKSNAKARSALGTMYDTGHCVPRDLPTAYSWFALALRVDPNNQIVEKDLSAVWNQMTPPERQLAAKMKQ